jgi:hypothetical protein
MTGTFSIQPAFGDESYQVPVIESFTVSTDEIEIASANRTLNFTLNVSHNLGISTITPILTLQGSDQSFEISTKMTRTDLPVNLKALKVTFKAQITVPTSFSPGLYSFFVEPIEGLSLNMKAAAPKTGLIKPVNFTNFPNAENQIRIRLNGDLNLNVKTFVGPTYDTTKGIFDSIPMKSSSETPIWRVGEKYDVDKYFEKRTPLADVLVSSSTASICESDGKILNFKSEGTCDFTVYTKRTSNYSEQKLNLSEKILAKRLPQVISLGSIPSQTVEGLPKSIVLPIIYTSTADALIPKSLTPAVCVATIGSVRLISGGSCLIGYKADENSNQLASESKTLSFEIVKNAQTINFTPVATADLASKTVALSAIASSGGSVSYTATPTDGCSVSGSTLNLLKPGSCAVTATQLGTGTIAAVSATATVTITGALPAVKKSITCVKGTKSVKKTAISPKCPAGYKLKK